MNGGPERFYGWPEVQPMFGGLSRMSVWRGVKAGRIPAPVAVSPNRKAWPESAILAWQAARMTSNPQAE